MYELEVLAKPLITSFWDRGYVDTMIDIVLALDMRAKAVLVGGREIPESEWPESYQNLRRLQSDLRQD
jgi:hypothetical protein